MSNVGAYASALRLDPLELLRTATLFPTVVAFQPWERRKEFEVAALHGVRTRSVGLSSLQTTSSFVPYRRLCSLCVRSDKRRFGWSYWHLSHHLPGVSLCSYHGIRLRTTTLTTSSGAHRWSYELPDGVDSVLPKSRSTNFNAELNRIALAMQAEELWSALGPLSSSFYRRLLVRAGLVSHDRQVSAAAARKWILDLMVGLATDSGLARGDPALTWVDRILRDRPGSPFPACQHLVIQAAIASTPRPVRPFLDHKSTGYRGKDVSALDAAKAEQLDAQLRLRLGTQKRFTLKEVLEALGIWGGFRHARAKYPAVSMVIERHRPALLRTKNRRVNPSTG